MLKILLAFLIIIELSLIPLMIYLLTGVSVVLPGLGLIISGGLISLGLLLVEVVLVFISIILFRRIRRNSERHP